MTVAAGASAFAAAGLYGIIPLLKISLWHMDARIGPVTVAYETIVVGALVLVGVGLSCCVLPRRRREGEA
ncbi:hypothetical protein [Skermanella pratensis]|uniref:hypothetical protein n=1 Tax=Skermanella pratensis TaxID=2233999 RepID=UPI0013019C14|nr:hypothetical protein [Skermanella pratensis]